jgi:hypothetical protein
MEPDKVVHILSIKNAGDLLEVAAKIADMSFWSKENAFMKLQGDCLRTH